MSTVVDDRLGRTIYADNIKLVKGVTRKTPSSSVERAGLQILAVDRSDLYSQLRMMGSDNIITPLEKKALEREWISLNSSLASTIQKIGEYDISEDTTTLAMYEAFHALEAFLAVVLDPTKMESNTDITNLGNIKDFFQAYYDSKTIVDERIFRLETGLLSGLDYRTKYTVVITSSTGAFALADGLDTTLRASVHHEGVDVTDNYLDIDFTWHRITEDRALDASWRLGQSLSGKTLTINKDDLIFKAATFGCTFKHFYSDTMYFQSVGHISLSEEIPAEDAISVQIFSSNGDTFRSGQCYTTMTAIVWQGKEDITHTLDESKFNWSRNSGDPIADEQWSTSSKAVGRKSILLTPDDVSSRSVFVCDVDL